MHSSPHTGYTQLKSYLQAWRQFPQPDETLAHEALCAAHRRSSVSRVTATRGRPA